MPRVLLSPDRFLRPPWQVSPSSISSTRFVNLLLGIGTMSKMQTVQSVSAFEYPPPRPHPDADALLSISPREPFVDTAFKFADP